MVNQDPQPEIFETVHTFDYTGGDIAANTMRSVDVFTYQANNEEFSALRYQGRDVRDCRLWWRCCWCRIKLL